MELISLFLHSNLNEFFFLSVVLLCTTSFLRISIIFGFIKIGLGLEGMSGALWSFIISLALCLTASSPLLDDLNRSLTTIDPSADLNTKNQILLETLKTNLENKISSADLETIRSNTTTESDQPQVNTLNILIPSYIISETKDAFKIGLKLLLPFIVIDLLVAHIFTAMGIVTLSSFSLAFSLKVILLASVGGWDLIVKNILGA